MKQAASTVFVVRPASFGFNAETAASNHFQQLPGHLSAVQTEARAAAEFEALVATLRNHRVRVLVFDDTAAPAKPDAVFPNNWLSLHADGRVGLYPMCAPNRRPERRPDIIAALAREFRVGEVLDWSGTEDAGRFLEGTGSIIFDHENRRAYAGLSPRTEPGLLAEVCARLGYRPVPFRSVDARGQEIYHTNVMLSIGPGFAVVCLESIPDLPERALVTDSLTETGHEIVDISLAQVARFAGNMLALQPTPGPVLLALSQSAHDALTPEQRTRLSRHATLLPLAIPTIETIGGGSVRCMLAEVFLPEI
ncbi:citrulline utilization hydrolase CtlX [Hymenobacter rubripertinctus]|uniref:Amidinotransferase n=1 Tax=Hymenobacter rubripertinctus TaxID=2029981 RepID=A0A418QVG3_9BACT|nr:arginine deiminase-related protein [Hymenobacter rubripertinctus]RIY09219.1 amidinotransferase [Hymenobacter rubripertinctus]